MGTGKGLDEATALVWEQGGERLLGADAHRLPPPVGPSQVPLPVPGTAASGHRGAPEQGTGLGTRGNFNSTTQLWFVCATSGDGAAGAGGAGVPPSGQLAGRSAPSLAD